MRKHYKEKLDSIFEMMEIPNAGSVVSDEDMEQMVKSGQASKDIKGKHSESTDSKYMRQIGTDIYVRTENPFSTTDLDKFYWKLKKSVATDASNGSGTGS